MCETGRFMERPRLIRENSITSTSCQSSNVMIHDSDEIDEVTKQTNNTYKYQIWGYSIGFPVISTRSSGSVTVTLFLVYASSHLTSTVSFCPEFNIFSENRQSADCSLLNVVHYRLARTIIVTRALTFVGQIFCSQYGRDYNTSSRGLHRRLDSRHRAGTQGRQDYVR
jgi:hypothetical protein